MLAFSFIFMQKNLKVSACYFVFYINDPKVLRLYVVFLVLVLIKDFLNNGMSLTMVLYD